MTILGFIQNISPTQLIFILLIVLLLFGAKRLPELARSFGKSLKEFKHATKDIEKDFRSAMEDDDDEAPAPSKRSDSGEKEKAYSSEKAPSGSESATLDSGKVKSSGEA